MRHRAIASILALAGFTASPLHAGGDIDPGFGDDGKVVLDAGSALYESQYGLARDGAGGLYIAGSKAAEAGDDGDFVVAKLDASGTPVGSFGDGGKAIIDFGGDDTASVVLVDANGDLYVAGYSDASGSDQFTVAKLDANGQLATGFGDGGHLLLDFGGTSSAVFAATLDASGNVYLAGTSNALGTYDFTVAKLDASGTLDEAFGDSGIATIDFGGDDASRGLALGAAGEIYLAGTTRQSGNAYLAATRLTGPTSNDRLFADDFDP